MEEAVDCGCPLIPQPILKGVTMLSEEKQMVGYAPEVYHKINWRWYHFISRPDRHGGATLDALSVLVLAEIVYWYTPYMKRDPRSPQSPPKYESKLKGKPLFISQTNLAIKFAVSKYTIQRAFKNLKRLGLISTTLSVKQASTGGALVNDSQVVQIPSKLKELEDSVSSGKTVNSRRSVTLTPPKHTSNVINLDQETTLKEMFDSDWEEYRLRCWDGRYGNKNTAYRSWKATLNRKGFEFRNELMERTTVYLTHCRVSNTYCKNASTFWGPDEHWEAFSPNEESEAELIFSKLLEYKDLYNMMNGKVRVVFTGEDQKIRDILYSMKKDKPLFKYLDSSGEQMTNHKLVMFKADFIKQYKWYAERTFPSENGSNKQTTSSINSNCNKISPFNERKHYE